MTIELLQNLCLKLPGITQDMKWEDHLCFNVGDKMFLVTSPDKFPPTASFKVTPEKFDELVAQEGFSPAQYLARYSWVYLDDISKLSTQEWEKFIRQSYELIASKLSKKIKKELGITSQLGIKD
jgi:predicted DNA-binding protein (MmcQ/YjbR family)